MMPLVVPFMLALSSELPEVPCVLTDLREPLVCGSAVTGGATREEGFAYHKITLASPTLVTIRPVHGGGWSTPYAALYDTCPTRTLAAIGHIAAYMWEDSRDVDGPGPITYQLSEGDSYVAVTSYHKYMFEMSCSTVSPPPHQVPPPPPPPSAEQLVSPPPPPKICLAAAAASTVQCGESITVHVEEGEWEDEPKEHPLLKIVPSADAAKVQLDLCGAEDRDLAKLYVLDHGSCPDTGPQLSWPDRDAADRECLYEVRAGATTESAPASTPRGSRATAPRPRADVGERRCRSVRVAGRPKCSAS